MSVMCSALSVTVMSLNKQRQIHNKRRNGGVKVIESNFSRVEEIYSPLLH